MLTILRSEHSPDDFTVTIIGHMFLVNRYTNNVTNYQERMSSFSLGITCPTQTNRGLFILRTWNLNLKSAGMPVYFKN